MIKGLRDSPGTLIESKVVSSERNAIWDGLLAFVGQVVMSFPTPAFSVSVSRLHYGSKEVRRDH